MVVRQPESGTNYYNEVHRPQFHFTPEKQWMNDPNGLVYYRGEYHLFYQYHPDGLTWGPMHWGHAVSKDLLHWEHLPIAMEPDHLGMIFSGSAIVDWDDTTGFFNGKDGLVAFFTHATEDGLQRQSIAYSKDNGRTWTKYAGNPVVPNPGIKDFRDPKVVWHEASEQWIMVLAAGQKVQFYGSINLLDWYYLSEFGQEAGAHGGVWECPDLFALHVNDDPGRMKWILQVDVQDGAYAGGSGAQYFIGNFNGNSFHNEQPKSQVNWVDYGKDFYATQSFSDIPYKDGRRIWLAWMSNWQYANEVPTNPWRSAMSVPREVRLVEGSSGKLKLIQQPVRELENIRGSFKTFTNKTVVQEEKLMECCYSTYELIVSLKRISAKVFGLKVKQGEGEETVIGYNTEQEAFFFDRVHAGQQGDFHEQFPSRQYVPLLLNDATLQLRIFVDRSSVEVFVNGGDVVCTNLILPSPNSNGISLFADGGEVKVNQLTVHELQSVWHKSL